MEMEMKIGSFVLASLLTSYPDETFQESVQELLNDESINLPQAVRDDIRFLGQSNEALDNRRSTYIEIFDHSKSLNPLYETEYGRERALFKANELSDIAGFYRAFGFEMDNAEGTREMPDHVSVELEFYSLLQMKYLHLQAVGDQEGCDIVQDGMRKFLKDHLGRFVGAIIQRPGVLQNKEYLEIFNWVAAVVNEECVRLGVTPDIVNWLSSQVADEEVSCGGTVALNK